jgi:hypothetical protein
MKLLFIITDFYNGEHPYTYNWVKKVETPYHKVVRSGFHPVQWGSLHGMLLLTYANMGDRLCITNLILVKNK